MSKQFTPANPSSPFHTGILICLVAVLSYFADMLGSSLMVRPGLVWPRSPGCAFLVAVLLLRPRRIWPGLVAAGLTGFVLYDAQTGLTLRSIVWLNLSDGFTVLAAGLGVSYSLGGILRLNSIKRLALYLLFAVILAPICGAFVAAFGASGNYWLTWRVS